VPVHSVGPQADSIAEENIRKPTNISRRVIMRARCHKPGRLQLPCGPGGHAVIPGTTRGGAVR
jgi:hypothetical protein